jgi:hypothetical protein
VVRPHLLALCEAILGPGTIRVHLLALGHARLRAHLLRPEMLALRVHLGTLRALDRGETLLALHARRCEGLPLHARRCESGSTAAASHLHLRAASAGPVVGACAGRRCDRQGGNARGEKHPGHDIISFRTAKTVRSLHRSNR